jgi:hypothetical protein
MTFTWGQLHVGDTVRGADQRAWEVVEREPGFTWAVAGEQGRFRLRLGDREVRVEQDLNKPVDLVQRADHSDEERAVGVLLDKGLDVQIVQEQLMAPAPRTEPNFDRWGRYLLPHPDTGVEKPWTRATTAAKTLADEYYLTLWKLRKVAKGISVRPDLIAAAAAGDPDQDKSTFNDIAKQAMDAAEAKAGANFGNAFHRFAERLDGGEPLEALKAPSPLDADLRAYQELLKVNQLRVISMEKIVVIPELGLGGKYDRIYSQPAGPSKSKPLTVGDLKSGKSVDWSWMEIVIQQAIYANATHVWDMATETYSPMPEVDKNRGLIIHAPIGKAHPLLYGIPIQKGWTWVQLALKVREIRNEAKRKGFAWLIQPEPGDLLLHNVSRAQGQRELARLWELYHPQGLWSEEVNTAAQARMAEINSQ